MADTMEEVMEEGGGLEPTEGEANLIKSIRARNINAEQVTQRIEAAIKKPGEQPSAGAPAAPVAPVVKGVTAAEVKTMFAEHTKQVEQSVRAREVQKEIRGSIGKLVDDSGLTKRTKRRERVVNEVFEALSGREDIAKLNDEEFHKVLEEETKTVIDSEREDGGASAPPTQEPKEPDEGRKSAAETMGQTPGNETPPRSAAETERPRGSDVRHDNLGDAFGTADRDWSKLSDGSLEQESSREAGKFLRKGRGK